MRPVAQPTKMTRTVLLPSMIGALLVLLTWLLMQSLDHERLAHAQALVTLRELGASEIAMQRNALRARAGLLRNYDPLVQDSDAERRHAVTLRDAGITDKALLGRADALLEAVIKQEDLLEQFKTNNALLQNSLAYFDQLAMRVTADARHPALAMAAGALTSAMLHLTRLPSAEGNAIVGERLAALSALAGAKAARGPADDAALLVRHGDMLSRLVMSVDASLRALLAGSSHDQQAAFLKQLDHVRAAGEGRAERFRMALYAVAVLLVGLLVALGAQLRARARALRHRSELERIISTLSARLIACAPEETDAILGEAVATLGAAFEADRCYLLRPSQPATGQAAECQVWLARGAAAPAGWPRAALELLLQPGDEAGDTDGVGSCNETGGVVHVAAVPQLPSGRLRDALTAAGVAGWIGVPLRHGEDCIGLLGFDQSRPGGEWPRGGLGLLRLASEVVLGALRRQRVLKEREALEARLSRARRLEAVGTFASGIAHNFNNVIGAILGHAEMAGDGLRGTEPHAVHVREIQRAGERARELVAHILHYGSRGSVGRKAVLVGPLLAETASLLRASLPPGISLRMEDGCGELAVTGDAVQLQQVFVNLISNAAQALESAAEPAGVVSLEIEAVRLAQRHQASHGEVPAGCYIRVAVVDGGVGMDEATRTQLFQPFFTTRPAGTGLGLATAWEIVRDHGGTLDVHSAVGQGTRMEVWLPALAPSPSTARSGGAGSPRRGAGQAVMVLNPDENGRHRDEDVLAALGYEPVGFPAIEAALRACKAHPDRFSAVLLDQAATNPDALAQTSLLHMAAPTCPIILVRLEGADLGVGGLGARDLAGSGVVEVLSRPVRPSGLAVALARCT